MSIYCLASILGVVTCGFLIGIVLRGVRTRTRNLFAIYLIVSLLFSLGTFIAFANFFPNQIRIWSSFFPLGGITGLIAYCCFVGAFTNKTWRPGVYLGYGAVVLVLVPLIILGYIPESAEWAGGGIQLSYGAFIFLLAAIGIPFIAFPVFLLVRRLQSLKDPLEQNRVKYLLVGVSVLTLFSIIEAIPAFPNHSLLQIGHLFNTLMISYAILRYQLPDIRLMMRKVLVYSSFTICTISLYLIVLSGLLFLHNDWSLATNLIAVTVVSVLIAWLFSPIMAVLQKGVDRLSYGKSYQYRQMLVSFTHRMRNVLDLNELAKAMLQPITRALHASQASLLLYDGSDFSTRFAERLIDGEPVIPIKLRQDSPIVTWLSRENKTLPRDLIDVAPEFKGLSEAESNVFSKLEIEALYPMKSNSNLIAILALGKKYPYGSYSCDDTDLIANMVGEAAVVIGNAQLYAEAKQSANTDELTGLFNHRAFHQYLDVEIARCSRFGEVFCLLYIDLDMFKTYNDTQGHLEGDKILTLISKEIRNSIRMIDIGFRYGGDEFAVILPYTKLDGANKVGERIRKAIESIMDTKAAAITCSIGIASWPADGLMREDIISAADTALYYAKQTGRNQTCLASKVANSEVQKMKKISGGKTADLDTIYALAATVDAKDHHTYGHSKKVARYATEIAEALGYSRERISIIRAAALLHDIGKIGISDELLTKTGPLSIEDWETIRSHPNVGVAILKHIDRLKNCLAAVQYHHERYDGSGYPVGLKGDNIPLDARIIGIADSYDAMTSSRPYRDNVKSSGQALEELKRCSGSQFDPTIVEIFTDIMEREVLEETKVVLNRH